MGHVCTNQCVRVVSLMSIISWNKGVANDQLGLQKSAGNFSTIQNLKCVLYTAPSLTTHTPSAKGLTRSYHWSVCFGRARFADSGKICAKHLHEAYLIDALVFALWFLFWRRSKRSPGYIYFLCRIPC